jgi:hypothetical protein
MDKRQAGMLNPQLSAQLSAQQQGLTKSATSQFNPLQKTPSNKVESGKK